jgi:hypothetical protein
MTRDVDGRTTDGGTTLRPLSAGDAVSASIRIYRERLRDYLPLALVSYLWVLVPVYGWAKFYMHLGLMSRLAFGDVIGEPEVVATARARVRSRLWSFLCVALQAGLRIFGIYILGILAISIIAGFLTVVLQTVLEGLVAGLLAIVTILGIIGLTIGFAFILIRFIARLFIAEVPLAIESKLTGEQSLNRSWQLTQNEVGRIQLVVVLSFFVTLPLSLLTGYIPSLVLTLLPPEIATSAAASLVSFFFSLAGGILAIPFWQIIKAVVYYDLRSRQEGLDLELRDRRTTPKA